MQDRAIHGFAGSQTDASSGLALPSRLPSECTASVSVSASHAKNARVARISTVSRRRHCRSSREGTLARRKPGCVTRSGRHLLSCGEGPIRRSRALSLNASPSHPAQSRPIPSWRHLANRDRRSPRPHVVTARRPLASVLLRAEGREHCDAARIEVAESDRQRLHPTVNARPPTRCPVQRGWRFQLLSERHWQALTSVRAMPNFGHEYVLRSQSLPDKRIWKLLYRSSPKTPLPISGTRCNATNRSHTWNDRWRNAGLRLR